MEDQINLAANADNTNYSWTGVLEFLIKEYRTNQLKESEWELEKKELEDRAKQLEGQLLAQESLNEDLMKRIKMLEYGIKKERLKFIALMSKNNKEDREKLMAELRKEENVPQEIEKILAEKRPEVDLPMKRAKRQRTFLKKILTQFDCSDIMSEVFEQDLEGGGRGAGIGQRKDSNQEIENELMGESPNVFFKSKSDF